MRASVHTIVRGGRAITVTVPPSACRACGGPGCARCAATNGYEPQEETMGKSRVMIGKQPFRATPAKLEGIVVMVYDEPAPGQCKAQVAATLDDGRQVVMQLDGADYGDLKRKVYGGGVTVRADGGFGHPVVRRIDQEVMRIDSDDGAYVSRVSLVISSEYTGHTGAREERDQLAHAHRLAAELLTELPDGEPWCAPNVETIDAGGRVVRTKVSIEMSKGDKAEADTAEKLLRQVSGATS